jgi:hypothetical protein
VDKTLPEAGRDAPPAERPQIPAEALSAASDFSWGSLVASTIHPVKVAIIETLLWVGEPLSATEMKEIFNHADYSLDMVLYHLRGLARLEVIEVTGVRRTRGAREKYYFLCEQAGE